MVSDVSFGKRVSTGEKGSQFHRTQTEPVGPVLVAIVAEFSAFAVEHHQFNESGGVADSLFVTGYCTFGFYDGRTWFRSTSGQIKRLSVCLQGLRTSLPNPKRA